MGILLRFRPHARASAGSVAAGRGTSEGQSPAGQLSENHRKARSRRPTLISAPSSSALSFFPSSSARELTVERGISSISAYRRATMSSCSMPDMAAISVGLPLLSTVNLPDAPSKRSGHSTGMDLTILLSNIDRYIRINKTTDNALSKRAGSADAIRNLRRYASGELKGMWTLDTLDAVARAMGTTPWELLKPPSPLALDEESRELVRSIVREELAGPKKARKMSR